MKAKFGLLLGILLLPLAVEGGARLADGGAFPHVNFYVEHPRRGLALAPGATERISFSGNPITTVSTNSQGLRGGEWAAPQAGEVLVLGDSQVFGLGLDEGQTLSATAAAALGRPVYNAGVPTYGPGEYLDLLDELLTARPGADVVIVWNAANDLFEAQIPNRDRHAWWDGWAVRKEHAPAAITAFPGRTFLMSQSHAVYALRQALYADSADLGVPSEGKAADLLPLAQQRSTTAQAGDAERVRTERALQAAVDRKAADAQDSDPEGIRAEMLSLSRYLLGFEGDEDLYLTAAVEGNNPGDIVYDQYAEGGRRIRITAEQLNRGAALRRQMPTLLRRWAAENPDSPDAARIRELIAREERRSLPDAEVAHVVAPLPTPHSPLHEAMVQAKARVEAGGGRLTIVMLPLDVQVSAGEWAKYGSEPVDMTLSLGLHDEVLRDAEALGLRTVDPLAALRAAEPGAFLQGDLHLSPQGAAVVGAAIAAALQGPPPPPWPGGGLPADRSRVPTAAEWAAVREIVVPGSTAAGCQTRQVREWLQLRCAEAPGGFQAIAGPLETLHGRSAGGATLVSPRLPGMALSAELHKADAVYLVEASATTARITRSDKAPQAAPPVALPAGIPLPDDFVGEGVMGCDAALLAPADWLDCVGGRRSALPLCSPGAVNAGATGHCYALCSEAVPCGEGRCTPWQGSSVCL